MNRVAWIFLKQVPARGSRRPVLFLVAVLVHVGIITALTDSARLRFSRKRADAVEPLLAVFIDETISEVPPKTEDVPAPLLTPPLELASPVVPGIPEISLPPDERNETPSIDWFAELSAAAKGEVARQAQRDALPRIGAHPKGLSPPKHKGHAPGETQKRDDGEVLTWVNDYCFFSNRVMRSNGMGGVKPECVDVPPPYQRFENWLKSRRKLADESSDE